MESQTMFLDCPACLDEEGAVRCGLPAEVRSRCTMNSSGGRLESAMIRCPSSHCFNAPIEFLTVKSGKEHALGSAGRAQLTALFLEARAGAGIIAHYGRLDGRGGFVVHELAEGKEQETGVTGSYGDEADGSFRETRKPPKPGSAASRSNCAPGYYLGWPASLWISVMNPRRRRNAPKHLQTPSPVSRKRTPSQSSGPSRGAGSETVRITPTW
jgi:hypothetical protein